jgi:hypothetical protein
VQVQKRHDEVHATNLLKDAAQVAVAEHVSVGACTWCCNWHGHASGYMSIHMQSCHGDRPLDVICTLLQVAQTQLHAHSLPAAGGASGEGVGAQGHVGGAWYSRMH